jgi:hypothetical protein
VHTAVGDQVGLVAEALAAAGTLERAVHRISAWPGSGHGRTSPGPWPQSFGCCLLQGLGHVHPLVSNQLVPLGKAPATVAAYEGPGLRGRRVTPPQMSSQLLLSPEASLAFGTGDGSLGSRVRPQMQNQGHPASEAMPTEMTGEAHLGGGSRMDLAVQRQKGGVAEAQATLRTGQRQPGLATPAVKPQGHPAREMPSTVGTAMDPARGFIAWLAHQRALMRQPAGLLLQGLG